MRELARRHAVTGLILMLTLVVVAVTGRNFASMRAVDELVIGPNVTASKRLSDYLPRLRNSPGDTDVYILEGSQPGGTMLVMGGIHPNEPAGVLAAVVALENARVDRGRLIVIPFANASAFTHNAAGHAAPQFYEIETEWGVRRFRNGDRLLNPLHQYPDPDVHMHHPSGSLGSGQEARNLNRNFPGRHDGTLTEAVAYGIQQLIHQEEVDFVLDLHEARPMNPIVNAVVVHERAADIGALALVDLEVLEGVSMRLEITPELFQGVSQRELGEHTPALAALSETPNIAMDYVHGPIDRELLLSGRDDFLARASSRPGLVYVDYDSEAGLPIEDRVGRHLSVLGSLNAVYNEFYPDRAVVFDGIPHYQEVLERGLGSFLKQPTNGDV